MKGHEKADCRTMLVVTRHTMFNHAHQAKVNLRLDNTLQKHSCEREEDFGNISDKHVEKGFQEKS